MSHRTHDGQLRMEELYKCHRIEIHASVFAQSVFAQSVAMTTAKKNHVPHCHVRHGDSSRLQPSIDGGAHSNRVHNRQSNQMRGQGA
jgi:hypothetical protein